MAFEDTFVTFLDTFGLDSVLQIGISRWSE